MNILHFIIPTKKKMLIFLLLYLVIFIIPTIIAFLTKTPLLAMPLAPFVLLTISIRYALGHTVGDVMYSPISPFQIEEVALVLAGIFTYLLACLIDLILKKRSSS